MRINWRVILAALIAAGVAFWAYDSVRVRAYSGTELTFDIGGGPVIIDHNGEEAATIRMTSPSTRGAFTVQSSTLDAPLASTREGTGRNVVHAAEFELPTGTTELLLTRGSSASAVITGGGPLEVSVSPMSESGARSTVTVAGIVIAAALIFTIWQLRSAWMPLIQRGSRGTNSTEASARA